MEEQEELSLSVLINRHKGLIFNIFIVLAALYFASKIYTVQMKKTKNLGNTRDVTLKTSEALEEIRRLENRLNQYRSFMNKDVSLVITTIAVIAQEASLRILAVNPEKEQDFPAYIRYPFSLTLEADNYKTLGIFMSKLESHHDIFIVDSAVIEPQLLEGGSKRTKLAITLKISTVLFK
jgi:Tfp pilus assembly protein PilO